MSDPIAVFVPTISEDEAYLWGGLICAFLALGGMIYILLRKFEYHEEYKKWIIAMLLFFIFMMSAGTSVFSWMAYQRIKKLALYEDRMTIGTREILYEDIKQIKLEKTQEKSMLNPNIVKNSVQLLLIEELGGKVHVLSEENFPVQRILGTLNATLKEKERQKDQD